MNNLQNLHTHCTFCDGKDTPEEMILSAIEQGFDSIGFSSHSYTEFAQAYCMKKDVAEEYMREIRRMREKYADKIDIYCGLELEMHSDDSLEGYDYIIGSTHYFKMDGEYVGFDRSAQEVKRVVDTYFHGDGMEYAKAYYEQMARLPERGRMDIVGHFDIVAKHAFSIDLFDVSSVEYLRHAYSAIDALCGKIPFFEVNTGCISRGYRAIPYPTLEIVKEFASRGFGAIITSDCHNAKNLSVGFDDAAELLFAAGYKERYILTEKGFEAVAIR